MFSNQLETKYNYNIDFLRISAMLMVVVLHVARTSGALALSTEVCFHGKIWSNIWEALSIYAVNIYALITGYLCINKKWRPDRFVILYTVVLFYQVGIYGLYYICTGNYPDPLMNLFPTCGPYWYVNAYFPLFFSIPFINILIININKKQHLYLLLMFIVCLCLFSFNGGPQLAQNGHNYVWLCVMYVFGAYIKLYPPDFSSKLCFALFILCAVTAFIILLMRGNWEYLYFRLYTSPVVLCGAIFFFLSVIKLQFRDSRILYIARKTSPLTFSVYLIHCHPIIWQSMHKYLTIFGILVDYAWWYIPAVSIALFIVCLLIDSCRLYIFNLLKLEKISALVTTKAQQGIDQIIKRII